MTLATTSMSGLSKDRGGTNKLVFGGPIMGAPMKLSARRYHPVLMPILPAMMMESQPSALGARLIFATCSHRISIAGTRAAWLWRKRRTDVSRCGGQDMDSPESTNVSVAIEISRKHES